MISYLEKRFDKKISRYVKTPKQKEIVKFIIKFNIFAIPFYIFLLFNFQINQLISLTDILSRSLLSFTGIQHEVLNNLIILPVENGTWAAFINWDCTGWKSIYAYFALVMATPFTFRKKLFGLLFIPFLYAINILRIWFMFYIASTNLSLFPVVHSLVWSWGLVAATILFFLLWIRFSKFYILRKIIR